jgi:Ulp1 family protease
LALVLRPNKLINPISEPAGIVVVDSLGIDKRHERVANELRKYVRACVLTHCRYLMLEWQHSKHNMRTRPKIDKSTFPAILPRLLPLQDNDFDCGVFLLQYLEGFLSKSPFVSCINSHAHTSSVRYDEH